MLFAEHLQLGNCGECCCLLFPRCNWLHLFQLLWFFMECLPTFKRPLHLLCPVSYRLQIQVTSKACFYYLRLCLHSTASFSTCAMLFRLNSSYTYPQNLLFPRWYSQCASKSDCVDLGDPTGMIRSAKTFPICCSQCYDYYDLACRSDRLEKENMRKVRSTLPDCCWEVVGTGGF